MRHVTQARASEDLQKSPITRKRKRKRIMCHDSLPVCRDLFSCTMTHAYSTQARVLEILERSLIKGKTRGKKRRKRNMCHDSLPVCRILFSSTMTHAYTIQARALEDLQKSLKKKKKQQKKDKELRRIAVAAGQGV